MNNRRYILPILCVLWCTPFWVHGQVVTEIMYNPVGTDSGHEWIEVFNSSASSIRLSEWRLYEGGTNHKIKAVSNDGLVPSGAFAVIAENPALFLADYPQYAGLLFDSSFSLANDGDSFVLRDKNLKDVNAVVYQSSYGALGDGNTLQRQPDTTSVFVARRPSPGGELSSDVLVPKPEMEAVPKPVSVSKSSKKMKSTTQESTVNTVTNEEHVPSSQVPQLAAAIATSPSSNTLYLWLAGVLVVVSLVVTGLIVARHAKQDEWDIVEESPEDV